MMVPDIALRRLGPGTFSVPSRIDELSTDDLHQPHALFRGGPEGELDRPKMASIVFADEKMRLLLNSIVHPLVFESQNAWPQHTRQLAFV